MRNPQSAVRNCSGMTLVEIMVVITIIAIGGMLVIPSVSSGLDSIRLRTSAERVASTFRYARERAQREQVFCQVSIDPADGSVELDELRPGDGRAAMRGMWQMPPEVKVRAESRQVFFFMPDGRAPRVDLALTNRRGRTATIAFDALTALPEVTVQ